MFEEEQSVSSGKSLIQLGKSLKSEPFRKDSWSRSSHQNNNGKYKGFIVYEDTFSIVLGFLVPIESLLICLELLFGLNHIMSYCKQSPGDVSFLYFLTIYKEIGEFRNFLVLQTTNFSWLAVEHVMIFIVLFKTHLDNLCSLSPCSLVWDSVDELGIAETPASFG